MPSFFSRVTRYRGSAALNPRENRLTEVFAAVLERVDGLAHHLVTTWLSVPVDPNLQLAVTTQRPTARGFFVDLELRFHDQDGDQLVCWVEIKHGAPLHGDQLASYLRDLKLESGTERHVVLLAPREAMPTDVPSSVPVATWQEVAKELEDWTTRYLDPVDAWLLEEFRDYLQEERLTDPKALTTSHAIFLMLEPETMEVLSQLHELTDEHLTQTWGPRRDDSTKNRDLNFWSIYPLAPTGTKPGKSWAESDYMEWGVWPDFRPDSEPVNVYCAGVTFSKTKQAPHNRGVDDGWVAARRADGFYYLQDEAGWWRLWRFMRPEQLLAYDRLDNQSKELSAWIRASFQAACEAPPEIPPKGA